MRARLSTDSTEERGQQDRPAEPLVLRVERELSSTGDVSEVTWTLFIRHIDTLPKGDLRRILDLLSAP